MTLGIGTVGRVALVLVMSGAVYGQTDPRRIGPPIELAAEGVETGIVRMGIRDQSRTFLPARVTFLTMDEQEPDLFVNFEANADFMAVRSNVVYTRTGLGRVKVPVGKYRVLVSRGLEYAVHRTTLKIEPGGEIFLGAMLRRAIDTEGWISGDFHLHTLTHSGHGDASMNERLISLVGEGVEFAVATDHNHNTDYGPTIEALDLAERIRAIPGNEVTTGIGHFNIFPVDPAREPVEHRIPDGNALFKLFREEPNSDGIVPIIQLNHPRWIGMDYFGVTGLDGVTAIGGERFSSDFDAIEVLNENAAWGYYDPDDTDVAVSGQTLSCVRDWFNLLNRGHRAIAVGNSDSHHVYSIIAGVPRNYIAMESIWLEDADAALVTEAIRAGQVFTTTGPFVRVEVNGAGMGAEVAAPAGQVKVAINVQAADWVDCDRVHVIVNGDIVEVIDIPSDRERIRLDTTHSMKLDHDSWIVVVVEGDDSMAPVVHDSGRPIRPLAITNPVRVDVDGDGVWTPPVDWAQAEVGEASSAEALLVGAWASSGESERGLLALAAIDKGGDYAAQVTEAALRDTGRQTRLCGARCAERLGNGSLLGALRYAWEWMPDDVFGRLGLLRAMKACGEDDLEGRLVELLEAPGAIERFEGELEALLPSRFVSEWMVLGYFDNPSPTSITEVDHGPETDPSLARVYAGKEGAELRWTEFDAGATGFVDLLRIGDPGSAASSIAYAQTWLYSEAGGEFLYTLGTDDGCRVYLDDDLIHEAVVRRGARPLQHVGHLSLDPGWNRVLVKVENGSGSFGLYFRVLGDGVESSRTGPADSGG